MRTAAPFLRRLNVFVAVWVAAYAVVMPAARSTWNKERPCRDLVLGDREVRQAAVNDLVYLRVQE